MAKAFSYNTKSRNVVLWREGVTKRQSESASSIIIQTRILYVSTYFRLSLTREKSQNVAETIIDFIKRLNKKTRIRNVFASVNNTCSLMPDVRQSVVRCKALKCE